MKVNVAQVRRNENGTAHFDLEEDFSAFESQLEGVSFAAPVRVHLQVSNLGKSLMVLGQIQTKFKVMCGRCLEDFIYPVDLNFEDEWVFSGQAAEERDEIAFVFEKDEVEISERIFEQIVLALPMRFICSPECQGLCPVCGVNRNHIACGCNTEQIDPRLAALAQWSKRD
ncbi:YceD family protein [Desulfitobacterium sp. AusDCA]|uniref:YceD family protein n=1 Tax=Desulfitobacterium sp. AusDCA TaxID=3240383 RepID=UPI003DA71059